MLSELFRFTTKYNNVSVLSRNMRFAHDILFDAMIYDYLDIGETVCVGFSHGESYFVSQELSDFDGLESECETIIRYTRTDLFNLHREFFRAE